MALDKELKEEAAEAVALFKEIHRKVREEQIIYESGDRANAAATLTNGILSRRLHIRKRED